MCAITPVAILIRRPHSFFHLLNLYIFLIVLMLKRTFSETLLFSVIDETLNQTERGFDINLAESFHNQFTFSSIHNQCLTNEHVKDLMVCCLPNDVKHLYQVMVRNKKLHLFLKRENNTTTKEQIMSPKLPPIKSLIHNMRPIYNIPVEIIYVNSIQDIRTHCGNKYFNGTLHAVGRSSAGNIYHAIGDNFAPLISQIILDYFLEPSLLHQPRMSLTGFQPVNHEQSHKHLQMMQDIMTHKSMSLAEMDGLCFRRVIWGHGVHVLYYDTVVKLRRLTADFAHNFVKKKYNLALPSEFRVNTTHHISSSSSTASAPSLIQSSSDSTLLPTNTSNNRLNTRYLSTVSSSSSHPFPHLQQQYSQEFELLHGLKIVLFTRGNSGRGRSIQGEELIINAFRNLGAMVASCCDFRVASLETQLAYAAHADVMMGLHGAAMVHGFFMPKGAIILELKTQFGFEKALFNIVADSRAGYYGQVDIREYMIKGGGGHRPVDTALVERTVKTLLELLKLKYNSGGGKSIDISVSSVGNRDDHNNNNNNNNNNINRKRSFHMKGVNNDNINSQHKHVHSHSRHPRNNNNQHNQKISAKNNGNNNRHLLMMLTNDEATNTSTVTDKSSSFTHHPHTYSSNNGYGQFYLLQPLSTFTATVTAKNGSQSIVNKPRLDAVSGPIPLLLPFELPTSAAIKEVKSQLSSPLPSLLSLTKSLLASSSATSPSSMSAIHQEGLNHILGPTVQHLSSTCRSTVLYAFRKQILHNVDEQLHCAVCTPFNAD